MALNTRGRHHAASARSPSKVRNMTSNDRKRLDRAIHRLSEATLISEALITEYFEIDIREITNEAISLPTARLVKVEGLCRDLSKTGSDLQTAIATKEKALSELTTRIDRARIALLDRGELVIARQAELAALQARIEALDDEIRNTDRAVSHSRYDIMRRQRSNRGNVPNLAMRVALATFTLIGVVIAVYLILRFR
jgi:hypothetical protein